MTIPTGSLLTGSTTADSIASWIIPFDHVDGYTIRLSLYGGDSKSWHVTDDRGNVYVRCGDEFLAENAPGGKTTITLTGDVHSWIVGSMPPIPIAIASIDAE
jgi:hypothetical protein